MQRRSFLKGLAGLAALSVAGRGLAITDFAVQTEEARLLEMLKERGVIEDQVFLLDDGLVIDWHDAPLSIRRCQFLFKELHRPDMVLIKTEFLSITDSEFRYVGEGKPKLESYCKFNQAFSNVIERCSFQGAEVDYGFYVSPSKDMPRFGGKIAMRDGDFTLSS